MRKLDELKDKGITEREILEAFEDMCIESIPPCHGENRIFRELTKNRKEL